MSTCLGDTIPRNDPHGVSVSLPTWESTLGWATRDPEILSRMKTGYPRFFIHRFIDELAKKIVVKFEETHGQTNIHGVTSTRRGLLFPSAQYASQCEEFLRSQVSEVQRSEIFSINAGISSLANHRFSRRQVDWSNLELHAVLYPLSIEKEGRSFWQHTGFGISSRYAEVLLTYIDELRLMCTRFCSRCSPHPEQLAPTGGKFSKALIWTPSIEDDVSKNILRQHIAKLYSTDQQRPAIKDIFLYQSGMTALTNVAAALLGTNDNTSTCEIICYGFPYVDTFRTISKVLGINASLYSDIELDFLETELERGRIIRAVFLEVAGNPLLRCPDLQRIRLLADKYRFVVVADDTIATPINVDLLPFVDVVCTSLTKMFSGACNVMGGSALLCPQSSHVARLRNSLVESFIDSYFPDDASVMERNSRDLEERVLKSNANAELLHSILVRHESVQEVFYPKGSSSQKFYDEYKKSAGGYGHLLSVIFKSPLQAIAFFDALDVAKGPSLGTNFTLACPYTLLAHFNEMEWAAKYGVTEHLVRISVGLEEPSMLRDLVVFALRAAENATLNTGTGS